MSRARRHDHAAYVRKLYETHFESFPPEVHGALQQRQFSSLPADFFAALNANGYAMTLVPGIDELIEDGGVATVRRFNIFGSMKQDAILDLVRREFNIYFFLTAVYALSHDSPALETFPIYVEKRVYAQPLLLQEVMKRAASGFGWDRLEAYFSNLPSFR